MPIRWWSLAFAIASVILVIFFIASATGMAFLNDPTTAMRRAGPLAAVIGVLLLIADVVLPIPSSLVMIANGALFGIAGGAILSLVGSVAMALAAFGIGRAGDGAVRRFLSPREYERAGAMLERWGVLAIVVTRPIPILAESVALLAGSSPLTWGQITLAATLGSIMPSVLYAWAGARALNTVSQVAIFAGVIAITFAIAAIQKFASSRKKPLVIPSRDAGDESGLSVNAPASPDSDAVG